MPWPIQHNLWMAFLHRLPWGCQKDQNNLWTNPWACCSDPRLSGQGQVRWLWWCMGTSLHGQAQWNKSLIIISYSFTQKLQKCYHMLAPELVYFQASDFQASTLPHQLPLKARRLESQRQVLKWETSRWPSQRAKFLPRATLCTKFRDRMQSTDITTVTILDPY